MQDIQTLVKKELVKSLDKISNIAHLVGHVLYRICIYTVHTLYPIRIRYNHLYRTHTLCGAGY